MQNLGVANLLVAIGGTDRKNVVVAGLSGTVLHSAGGGAAWVSQNAGTHADFYVVQGTMTDIYVAGNPRTVIGSRDGGKAWRTLLEYDPMLPAVEFAGIWSPGSAGNLYVVGSQWVYHTPDDGRTWTITNLPQWSAIWSIWGSSETDLFIGGGSLIGNLAHSIDGGKNWAMQPTMLAPNDGVYSMWGSGADDIYAIGASSGTILHTVDGGKSWTIQSKAPRSLWHIWGSGKGDVYAVGRAGLIMHFQ